MTTELQNGTRADIKNYLLTRYQEILPEEFQVYLNRPMSIQDTSSYLSILTLNENARCLDESPRRYESTLFLSLELGFFANTYSGDNYVTEELYFDRVVQLVAAVLKQDEHINNMVSDSKLGDTQFRTESGGERPCFIANVNFTCEFYEDVGIQEILDTLSSFTISPTRRASGS